MSRIFYIIFWGTLFLINCDLYGQNTENCFLNDFEPKSAEMPHAVNADKPVDLASVIVTIQGDTLGKISKYIYGNAIAAWAGNSCNNATVVYNTQLLAPTLIRFPGGSWADGYFWNGVPTDVPDSVYDGTTYNSTTKTAKRNVFSGQTGIGGWQTTPDQYYQFISQVGTKGLITVNYAYARYGTSSNPVAKAAHLAAEWVRYDRGRTRFWEIGNENDGPWEYGWMIDTNKNKDGQPQIITGELYGKHFNVFIDSMKAAAKEVGATIYIGGQVIHSNSPSGWSFVDNVWNEGFFREAGDVADFYVMHNYFSTASIVKDILNYAVTEPKKDIDFIRQDVINKKAYTKPVALTEYNIDNGAAVRGTSYINGMQAVILISEMIKNNFGLGARWLLITGDGGMFYAGSDANYLYQPHPDFYYLAYLQKFYGDHAISTASSNTDILCYASKFSSGETGVVIVNKDTARKVISMDTKSIGVGQHYYIISFTGGTDNGDFSQNVYINEDGPSGYQWGPYEDMFNIPANSYTTENGLKLISPGRSVQMIMIDGGNNYITSIDKTALEMPRTYNLCQNYPNPFNPSTVISYQLPANDFVALKVFDVVGREIETLVNEQQKAGNHSVQFNASKLPSGVYFYRIEAGTYHDTKKLLLLK